MITKKKITAVIIPTLISIFDRSLASSVNKVGTEPAENEAKPGSGPTGKTVATMCVDGRASVRLRAGVPPFFFFVEEKRNPEATIRGHFVAA